MSKIELNMKIKSQENHYHYEGLATLNRDIISYNEKEFNYQIDWKIKRIIKKGKESTIKLDLNNKELTIISSGQEYRIQIEVFNLYQDDRRLEATYKLEENSIQVIVKINRILEEVEHE